MKKKCFNSIGLVLCQICYSYTVHFFQIAHVSSGEESVMNGVNTDNDETSKDSEGKVMLCFWIIV